MRNIFSKYLVIGLVILLSITGAVYYVINNIILPDYTLHDVTKRVPDVINKTFDDAESILQAHDLRIVEVPSERLTPGIETGLAIDQNPKPNTLVKPNRNVYVTINTGEIAKVTVPNILGISEREAQNMLFRINLEVGEIEPDPTPSPYKGNVTSQSPPAGSIVPENTPVHFLIGQGLGNERVRVPDIVGLTVPQAKRQLLQFYQLHLLITNPEVANDTTSVFAIRIISQDPAAGRSIVTGSEVRVKAVPVDLSNPEGIISPDSTAPGF